MPLRIGIDVHHLLQLLRNVPFSIRCNNKCEMNEYHRSNTNMQSNKNQINTIRDTVEKSKNTRNQRLVSIISGLAFKTRVGIPDIFSMVFIALPLVFVLRQISHSSSQAKDVREFVVCVQLNILRSTEITGNSNSRSLFDRSVQFAASAQFQTAFVGIIALVYAKVDDV